MSMYYVPQILVWWHTFVSMYKKHRMQKALQQHLCVDLMFDADLGVQNYWTWSS